jgi:hypothetical protein
MRRRSATAPPAYYRGVPVVNLLAVESKRPLRLFGAEGRVLLVRAALVVLALAGAAGYVTMQRATERYADQEAVATRRAADASDVVTEAEALAAEIETLKSSGGISERDLAFLKGDPRSLVAAVQSVISLDVTGVDILSIESSPPDGVDVRLKAVSNFAALEWRRLIGASPGVERVLSFDPSPGEPLVYQVRLVSGGR